jgi:hypothetical protein
MKRLILAGLVGAVLSSCAVDDNRVTINGEEFIKDENGVLHLSDSSFNAVTNKEGVKFVEGELPPVKITEREYEVVQANEEAFFSLVGQANPDEDVSMLVKPGSLKANLERVVSENGWQALHYDGPDMYIDRPSLLEAANVPMATMSLIVDYDLYPCFDEKAKVVTIIKD